MTTALVHAMAELEAILSRLLVPDNAVIQQVRLDTARMVGPLRVGLFLLLPKATQELKEVYKHPSVVPSLCECLVRSMSAEVSNGTE